MSLSADKMWYTEQLMNGSRYESVKKENETLDAFPVFRVADVSAAVRELREKVAEKELQLETTNPTREFTEEDIASQMFLLMDFQHWINDVFGVLEEKR